MREAVSTFRAWRAKWDRLDLEGSSSPVRYDGASPFCTRAVQWSAEEEEGDDGDGEGGEEVKWRVLGFNLAEGRRGREEARRRVEAFI